MSVAVSVSAEFVAVTVGVVDGETAVGVPLKIATFTELEDKD